MKYSVYVSGKFESDLNIPEQWDDSALILDKQIKNKPV